MNLYHLGFGIPLISIMVTGMVISTILNIEDGFRHLYIIGFLGIVMIGYSIFSPEKYYTNPCVCGHKDYYHNWDIIRTYCEQCNCRKFKEVKYSILNSDEFLSFEEWRSLNKGVNQ